MKQKNDILMMDIARRVAEESYDPKTRVGCVIESGGNILSYSYNGTPTGRSNQMRDSEFNTLDTVLHAESNAIVKGCQSATLFRSATMYVTRAPCIECAKLAYQSGISRVVYDTEHSNDRGKQFLTYVGIKTEKLADGYSGFGSGFNGPGNVLALLAEQDRRSQGPE